MSKTETENIQAFLVSTEEDLRKYIPHTKLFESKCLIWQYNVVGLEIYTLHQSMGIMLFLRTEEVLGVRHHKTRPRWARPISFTRWIREDEPEANLVEASLSSTSHKSRPERSLFGRCKLWSGWCTWGFIWKKHRMARRLRTCNRRCNPNKEMSESSTKPLPNSVQNLL